MHGISVLLVSEVSITAAAYGTLSLKWIGSCSRGGVAMQGFGVFPAQPNISLLCTQITRWSGQGWDI